MESRVPGCPVQLALQRKVDTTAQRQLSSSYLKPQSSTGNMFMPFLQLDLGVGIASICSGCRASSLLLGHFWARYSATYCFMSVKEVKSIRDAVLPQHGVHCSCFWEYFVLSLPTFRKIARSLRLSAERLISLRCSSRYSSTGLHVLFVTEALRGLLWLLSRLTLVDALGCCTSSPQ